MNVMTKTAAIFGLLAIAALPAKADTLVSFQQLSPEAALKLAQATMEACRKMDFQVAVAVVDRAGNTQVMLRDIYAGAHTPETAVRKAWTAVSFKTPTVEMAENTQYNTPASGIRFVTNALMLGGGVPIDAAGSMVGAVAVSGAPSGVQDDECARQGLESIQDDLAF